MMKCTDRVLFGCLALLLPISGFACSTAQWSSQSGAVVVGSPIDVTPITRVSEFCAMRANDTGHVQDNNPTNHLTFIARFYVRPQLTGTGQADLFIAYASETPATQLFKVTYDGANLEFHTGSATVLGGVAATAGSWHLVEVKYVSGGNTEFWVNKNATVPATPDGSFASATGGVEAVRLGLPNGRGGLAGTASFDAYESHSTTPVGPLLIGDANGNGTITTGDYAAVQRDLLGTLQSGQPDCNLSGSVTTGDYRCIQQKILGQ
ncbi:MAG TPA: dockerin type I repeat-containing protein [Xanthomonadales bacterium]|nr:dockerin type I repeat-containing protein [Xanthomonadales bacterium]